MPSGNQGCGSNRRTAERAARAGTATRPWRRQAFSLGDQARTFRVVGKAGPSRPVARPGPGRVTTRWALPTPRKQHRNPMTKSELIEILSQRQAHLKGDDVDLA